MTTVAKNVQPPSPPLPSLSSGLLDRGAVIAVEVLKEVLRHQRWLASYLSSNQFGDSPIFLFYDESNMSFLERRMSHGVISFGSGSSFASSLQLMAPRCGAVPLVNAGCRWTERRKE
jgi:hypothetical protein